MNNLTKRTIGGLLLLGLIVGFIALRLVHVRFFDGFIMLLAVVSAVEAVKAINSKKDSVANCSLFFVLLSLVAGYIFFLFFGLYMFFAGIAIAVLAMFVYKLFNKSVTTQDIAATFFIMFYPTSFFAFMFQLNSISDPSKVASAALVQSNLYTGLIAIALLMLISCGSDIFAFIFGMSLGRFFKKKLAPSISPKKTVIGAIGGLVGGMFGAFILFLFCYNNVFGLRLFTDSVGLSLTHFLIMGAVGSVFTQAGDLAASMFKRYCKIKDFGTVMLGHGGIMDRWDGILFNGVFIFTYLSILELTLAWTVVYA